VREGKTLEAAVVDAAVVGAVDEEPAEAKSPAVVGAPDVAPPVVVGAPDVVARVLVGAPDVVAPAVVDEGGAGSV
jgi:hypothetical protein